MQEPQGTQQERGEAELDRLVAAMPLEEQVGQLIIAYVPGTELNAETVAYLRECHVGGAVLMGHNVESPEQTRELTARIEAVCGSGSRPGLPGLLADDQ